ncbi:hypothetical protein ACLOJK_012031 [Asimina triloba]
MRRTILEAIIGAVDPSTDVVFSEKNPMDDFLFIGYDYAIVVVGEQPYAETNGDNQDLRISEEGLNMTMSVCAMYDCVVVIISGRPLVIEPYLPRMKAVVAAWLPGTEGQGVTDLLFGDYGFTGKLPRTWFRSVDQLPMNVGDEHYDPLFPFGYGLTTNPITSS